MQQFRVPADEARSKLENVLNAKLSCPLRGDYKRVEFGPGPVRWKATNGAAELMSQEVFPTAHYRAAWLRWISRFDLELAFEDVTLVTHMELDVRSQRDPGSE